MSFYEFLIFWTLSTRGAICEKAEKDPNFKYLSIYTVYIYIYMYRLKAGGSPELRGTLSLDAIPERSFLYTDGGGWGGGGGV